MIRSHCATFPPFRERNEVIRSRCAKAAYLSTLIGKGAESFERYDGRSISDMRLSASLPTRLSKLRLPSPEAYYYWVKTGDVLDGVD